MPLLSTSDLQPLPLFLHPHFFLRPPSPTSTTSSWFGAGARGSREAGAGQRHRTAGSRGRGRGRGLGADEVALKVYFTVADEFEMPSKKHRIVPAGSLPGKGRGSEGKVIPGETSEF